MIYFDQAASSFPKPKEVADAVKDAIVNYGANPGRGGHALANQAASTIYKTRVKLASLFGLKDPKRVVFFQNSTGALNQGIKGLGLQQGDHVITTSYEHNSVRRPLEHLRNNIGIEISYIRPDVNGSIDKQSLLKMIKPTTKLIVATHGSNLTGMIVPIKELGEIAKKHNICFMVDASQTAGILPIDMEEMGINLLAFAGHKGLLGPQGTGALLIDQNTELQPLIHGGTGNYSEQVEQPSELPERLESGTLNTPGIAGLLAGIEAIERIGLDEIYEHEAQLTTLCIEGLKSITGVHVYGPDDHAKRLAVVPFVIEGIDSQEVATILDQHYQIAVRAGLHCSPLAHEQIGTISSGGSMRVSFGIYNTEAEVAAFIDAVRDIQIGYMG